MAVKKTTASKATPAARKTAAAKKSAPAKTAAADPAMETMFRNYKRSMQQMQYGAYLSKFCKKYAQPAENQAVAE